MYEIHVHVQKTANFYLYVSVGGGGGGMGGGVVGGGGAWGLHCTNCEM